MNFPWAAIMSVQGRESSRVLVPVVRDREHFFAWLSSEYKPGDDVWLTVTKPSKSRTHNQFKYLYSCVYAPMAEDIGCDMITMDGIMKKRHLTVNPDSPLEFVRNKTDLNRTELATYIDDCRRDAAEMQVETQDPIGE